MKHWAFVALVYTFVMYTLFQGRRTHEALKKQNFLPRLASQVRVEHLGLESAPVVEENLNGVRDEDFVPPNMKIKGVDKHGMTARHNWYYTRTGDIIDVYMGKLSHRESDETMIWMLYTDDTVEESTDETKKSSSTVPAQ